MSGGEWWTSVPSWCDPDSKTHLVHALGHQQPQLLEVALAVGVHERGEHAVRLLGELLVVPPLPYVLLEHGRKKLVL